MRKVFFILYEYEKIVNVSFFILDDSDICTVVIPRRGKRQNDTFALSKDFRAVGQVLSLAPSAITPPAERINYNVVVYGSACKDNNYRCGVLFVGLSVNFFFTLLIRLIPTRR